jgi:uncharacterized protein (DUF488 family)
MARERRKVFTIGYGGRTRAEVLGLLKAHGVKTLADIRVNPHNAYMGTWVKAKTAGKGIEAWLAAAGIAYGSFIELGNRFIGLPDWKERYEALLREEGDQLTERVRAAAAPYCLFCAERFATDCHRQLVARYLAERYGAVVEDL